MWGCENEEDEWKDWLIVKDGGGKRGGGLAGPENWPHPQSLTSFSQADAKQNKHQYVSARLEANLAPQRRCAGPRSTTGNILLVYVFWAMSFLRIEGEGYLLWEAVGCWRWRLAAETSLPNWRSEGVAALRWTEAETELLLPPGRNFGGENLILQNDSCKMLEAALVFCSVT